MRLLAFFSSCAFVAFLAGCPGEEEGSSSGGKGCAADNRKDVYTQGLTKSAGGLSVRLVDATPGPPIKGTNAMTIEVVDENNAPVDGATIAVTPWMPDHGHGSAVRPEVAAMGGGRYAVSKVYLPMAGLWELKVSVQRTGSLPQEAVFNFCLDG